MSDPAVLERMDDGIAVVTLNRPERLNAVDGTLRAALTGTLNRLNGDDAVRAVVLTGAGPRAFCAGQDLEETASMQWQGIVPWLTAQHAMYQSVRDLDKPCVAAINGVAAGAGFQIGLCADWRVIAPETRIGQPEVKAGLASIVGSYLMTLYTGMTHNVALSLTGELVTGQRAYEMGLVSELAPATQVFDAAVARARAMAALPTTAVRVSKQRFRAMTQPGFDEALAAAVRAQLECYAHGEARETMLRFLAERARRRPPG